MDSTELISVIIPIYKVEKYLNKCIQSVVEQTYENLEIILVNDGSPDNCPKICDEWKKKDKRIKVIHKSNGGLSDARNTGMSVATGMYIGFVDSDDYIERDMYEKLYETAKHETADVVICDFKTVTEQGESISQQSAIKYENFSGVQGLKKIAENYGWRYVTVWNKLYRKDILDGILFPVGKIHEDEFVIHKIFFRCQKITSIAEILYNYLQRDGSITKQKISVKNMDIIDALCERSDFYKKERLLDLDQELCKSIKSIYDSRRIQLVSNKKEKKRLQEIDGLFRKNFFVDNNISFLNRIKYTFPDIWFSLCRIKWKIKNMMVQI